MSEGRGELRTRLSEIGEHAADSIEQRASSERAKAAFTSCVPWTLVAPCAALALHGIARVAGWSALTVPTPLIVLFGVSPFLLQVVPEVVSHWFAKSDATKGLHELDRELKIEGRLETAYEFTARPAPSAFERAAIEDAVGYVARAHGRTVDPGRPDRLPFRSVAQALAAVLIGWLAVRIAPERVPSAADVPTARATSHLDAVVAAKRPEAPRPPPPQPPAARETPRPKSRDAGATAPAVAKPLPRQLEDMPRDSLGDTGEGKSTTANSASRSSNSQGFPSSQAQMSESPEEAKLPAKELKPSKPKEAQPPPKKKAEEPSGATAGRGVGKGSSRNPGSTDWVSKDQVTNDQEDPLDEDEEVDDENDEQEARGGLQPALRDRRPAVNRDLTIGFGNLPNPDANGRGGPAQELKKSRGVASLVLGIPVPDHVKGHPNPGRTKVTQERVKPQAENAAPIAAQPRSPRSQNFGSFARHELEPWMRELIRAYFLSLRKPS